jgi:hypothetical protein
MDFIQATLGALWAGDARSHFLFGVFGVGGMTLD